MSTAKDKFNRTVCDFVEDLLIMKPNDKDLLKMSNLTSVSDIEKNIFIKNFQKYFLRDLFVKSILNKDVEFFIQFDFTTDKNFTKLNEDIIPNESFGNNIFADILKKIKTALQDIKGTSHEETIFKWFTLLIYYAYLDLKINPNDVFKTILSGE